MKKTNRRKRPLDVNQNAYNLVQQAIRVADRTNPTQVKIQPKRGKGE
jgi:hypothetical protein